MARVLSPIEQDAFEPVRLAEHASTLPGIAASRAKNLFGRLMERAMAKPVVITKGDRPAAVMLSPEAYLDLLRNREELLTLKALAIETEQGYLGEEETAQLFAGIKRRAAGEG